MKRMQTLPVMSCRSYLYPPFLAVGLLTYACARLHAAIEDVHCQRVAVSGILDVQKVALMIHFPTAHLLRPVDLRAHIFAG